MRSELLQMMIEIYRGDYEMAEVHLDEFFWYKMQLTDPVSTALQKTMDNAYNAI